MDAHRSGPPGPRMTFRRLMTHSVKEVVGRVLVGLGIHRRLLRGKAIVVAFHSITPGRSDGALRCSLEDFERYCAFFAKHMKTEPFAALVGHLAQHEPLTGEVVITFDDGYA